MRSAPTEERQPWPAAAAEDNPPGETQLHYRVGSYSSFLDLMLDRLVDPDGGREGLGTLATVATDAVHPLALREVPAEQLRSIRPNLTETENWLIGVLKGWASVADVLVFYQERLIQEGYLRTARELRSVYELGRLLHLRPRPAVAGTVDLAFAVSNVEGLPKRLQLEAGTVARSVPQEGAPPQAFETVAPLVVDASVNQLEPTPPREPAAPMLTPDATSAQLAGTATGLAVGGMVLITGRLMPVDEPVRVLRQVRTIKARIAADLSATEITWQQPLRPAADGGEIVELAIYAFRAESRLFGHNAPAWKDQPLAIQQQAQPLLGGIQVAEAAGEGWRACNQDLSGAPVVALAFDRAGAAFAAIAGEGMMRSRDRGRHWEAANGGLQERDVLVLAVGPDSSIYAGTGSGGIYRTTDQGTIWEPLFGRSTGDSSRRRSFSGSPSTARLPTTAVRALAFARRASRTDLLVGSDSGVYRSKDHGTTWQPTNRGLPGVKGREGETDLVVSAVVVSGQGDFGTGEARTIWIGTAHGVFRRSAGRRPWRPTNLGLPRTDPFSGLSSTQVTALATYCDHQGADRLVAGTRNGIYLAESEGERWRAASTGPTGSIRSLRVVADPVTVWTAVFAVADDGLWRSEDGGDQWLRVDLGVAGPVSAMAAGTAGVPLMAATPFGGFLENEWPGFRPARDHVDLDRVVPGVLAGGWIALQSEDRARTGVYVVADSGAVHREDFLIAGTVTQAAVQPPVAGSTVASAEEQPALDSFAIRRTTVLASSEFLELAPRMITSPQRAVANLIDEIARLDVDRALIVEGQRAGRRAPHASAAAASDAPGQRPRPSDGETDPAAASATDSDQAAADEPPSTDAMLAASRKQPRLAQATTAGILALALQEMVDASGEDDSLSPVALPTGRIDRGPSFDAESIRVFGNVVSALEGTTVRDEILGDGDAARAHQRFVLAQPVAFVPGSPPHADLVVQIRGERWEPVAILVDVAPESRVYRLDVEPDGRATLVFGDGIHGARIPTGRGNVTATYRTGLAPFAPRAGTVTLAEKRPLGLATVTNPAAAARGAPADTQEDMRARAPHLLRTLSRVVSVRDYEDFAARFPGIARARSWALPIAGSPAVHVTIAASEGAASPADGPLARSLRQALDRVRAGDIALSIAGFEPVRVRVAGTLRVDPRHAEAGIRQAVDTLLQERFGFDASRFESVVSAADLTSALQRIPGVRGVDLDTFASSRPLPDEAPPLRWRRARGPSWTSAHGLRAAELVMIDSRSSLALVVAR